MKKFYPQKTIALLLFALILFSANSKEAFSQNVSIMAIPNNPPVGNIGLGADNSILTVFMAGGANATLNSLTVNTAGTYAVSDLKPNGFKLWRAQTNTFDPSSVQSASLVSQVAVVSTGNSLTFTGLSEAINEFDGAMFYITADIAENATAGKTISLAAIPSTNFSFTPNNVDATTLDASATQTILPLINIYSYNLNAENVSAGSSGVNLFGFQIMPQDNDPVLQSITVPTYGSYQLSDIAAGSFKLWYDSGDDVPELLSTATAVSSGGNLVFSGLSKVLAKEDYHQFSITVDLAASASAGTTIGINTFTFSNFTFDQAYGLWGNVSQGNLATVEVPAVTVTSEGPAAGNISQGSLLNNLYIIKILSTNSGAAFTQVTFTTSGTYQTSDISSFKLFSGDEDGIEDLIGSVTPVASGGDLVFNLPNVAVPEAQEVYAYLTVDVSATAVAGRTISIQAPATSDISVVTGTVTVTASAGAVQTITAPALAFSPVGPTAGTVSPGTLANLHTVQVVVSGASATFSGASFTINGTYQASDIGEEGFYLVYHKTPNVIAEINSDEETAYPLSNLTTVPASGGTLTFPFIAPSPGGFTNPSIPLGTGYISIIVDINSSAAVSRTIQINSAGTSSYSFASGTKSGTTGNGGIQTIGIPSIAISAVSTPASNVSPNSGNQLYAAKLDITNASAVLEGFSVTLAGTFQNSEISSFELYVSEDNKLDLAGENNDRAIGYESMNGSTVIFDDLDMVELPAGSTRYLFLVANLNYSAISGRTINVTATPTSAFDFVAGTVSGTSPLAAGGTLTIATPVISLFFPVVTGGQLSLNSDNNVIYRFDVTATDANAALNSVQITTAGSYSIADLKEEGFKLWFNTSNSIAGSILISDNDVEASGSSFHLYADNVNIAPGTTGYFFITADISSTATSAHTLKIESASFNFNTATPSVTPPAGPEFTIAGTTSILGRKSVNEAVIFPNPSSQDEQVKITFSTASQKVVTLYSSTGTALNSYTMNGNSIQLENLEKGMYLITIQNLATNQFETQKLIVE